MFVNYIEVILAIEKLYQKIDTKFSDHIELKIYIKSLFELLIDLKDYLNNDDEIDNNIKLSLKGLTQSREYIHLQAIANQAKHKILTDRKYYTPEKGINHRFKINQSVTIYVPAAIAFADMPIPIINNEIPQRKKGYRLLKDKPNTNMSKPKIEKNNDHIDSEYGILFAFNNEVPKDWKTYTFEFICLWNTFFKKQMLKEIHIEIT